MSEIKCKECGVNCERTSNNQRYCESCRGERRIIKKREYNINWKINNPEKVKESNKNDKTNHKERRCHEQKRYRTQHPDRVKAQAIANRKVKILEGQICEICKKELVTEKHHEDYNKPLEVKFVCKKCHTKIHRGGD